MRIIVKKSLLAFLVLFYITTVFTSTYAATLYTTGSSVNMRKSGSANAAKVYTISGKGQAVTTSGSVKNIGNSKYWTKVTHKDSKNKTHTGYIRNDLLTTTKPSGSSNATNGSVAFKRGSKSFLQIAKNCKTYYAKNKFTYNKGSGAIPADNSKSTKTDCSAYVCWVLYEYASANGKSSMKKHYSKHIYSESIGNSSYMTKVKVDKKDKLKYAKTGDILIYSGHVEIYAGSSKNGKAVVYNCGDTSYIQNSGSRTASRSVSKIKEIWRVR